MPKENYQYQSKMPGVYIEEISSGSNPIVGVGTSTVAFFGSVANSIQYPNEPKLISSWNEFVDTYGESNNEFSLFEQLKYLPYAVHCFFNEGGTRCYIVNETRVTEEDSFRVQKKESLKNKSVELRVEDPIEGEKITFKLDVSNGVEILAINYNELNSKEYSSTDGITNITNDGSNGYGTSIIRLKRLEEISPEVFTPCKTDLRVGGWTGVEEEDKEETDYRVEFQCYKNDEDEAREENGEVIFYLLRMDMEDGDPELVVGHGATFFVKIYDVLTDVPEKIFRLKVIPYGEEEETLKITFDDLNFKEYSSTEGISGDLTDDGSSQYVKLKKSTMNSPMPYADTKKLSESEDDTTFMGHLPLGFEQYFNRIRENLKKIDDINIIAFPDMVSLDSNEREEYIKLGYTYCFEREYCFFIIDPPEYISGIDELTDEEKGFLNVISEYTLDIDNPEKTVEGSQVNKYSAIYFPWIQIANPIYNPYGSDPLLTNETIMVPPSGAIAGIYARTDANRGVWKAPAGLEDGRINCAQDVETTFTVDDYGLLNGYNINAIRTIRGAGVCVWGARTIAFVSEGEKFPKNNEWRYINVRRLFNYVEHSLHQNLQWAVFEPNRPELWGIVKRNITAFLTNLWKAGAFFGKTPEEAFFVKVDENNNPPEIRDEGILIIEVGIAPIKPAEFIVVQINQMTLPG